MDRLVLGCLKVEVPRELLLKTLSNNDPFYRGAFAKRAPSARWVDELLVVSPVTEYRMVRERIFALTLVRPYLVTKTWVDFPPRRAFF